MSLTGASIVKSKFDPSLRGGFKRGGASQNAICITVRFVCNVKYNIIRKKGEIIIFSKTWRTVTIGIYAPSVRASFVPVKRQCASAPGDNETLRSPSHPLADAVVAKML